MCMFPLEGIHKEILYLFGSMTLRQKPVTWPLLEMSGPTHDLAILAS